jgi:hypothetical protein
LTAPAYVPRWPAPHACSLPPPRDAACRRGGACCVLRVLRVL